MSGQDAPTRRVSGSGRRQLGGFRGRGRDRSAIVAAALVLLAGCGSGAGGSGAGGERTLDVLAASSLAESFQALADSFEESHPGVTVRLVLESSATLATQVTEGAPADVLATADQQTMQGAVDAGAAEDPQLFATNELVMVTPADNPGRVQSLSDLESPDVSYVACVETAPCGALAADLLARDHVDAQPRSLEVDVKAVLAKVTADEADAGLVYATDARAAGKDVQTFPVPGAEQQRNPYEIAVVDQSDDPGLAGEWVDLVTSPAGQQVLTAAGFGPPVNSGTS